MRAFRHEMCTFARRAYENEIASHKSERSRHFLREESCICDFCSIDCIPDCLFDDNFEESMWIAFFNMERATIFNDFSVPFEWFEVI